MSATVPRDPNVASASAIPDLLHPSYESMCATQASYRKYNQPQPATLGAANSRNLKIVAIHTDGSCKGNGCEINHGGWSAILTCGVTTKELSGSEGNTTNNRMELLAVISGLEALKEHCAVTIFTDSEYVRGGMTNWLAGWKKNAWRTSSNKEVKNRDLWERLDLISTQHTINWQWVKGHASNRTNNRADELAQEAACSR